MGFLLLLSFSVFFLLSLSPCPPPLLLPLLYTIHTRHSIHNTLSLRISLLCGMRRVLGTPPPEAVLNADSRRLWGLLLSPPSCDALLTSLRLSQPHSLGGIPKTRLSFCLEGQVPTSVAYDWPGASHCPCHWLFKGMADLTERGPWIVLSVTRGSRRSAWWPYCFSYSS